MGAASIIMLILTIVESLVRNYPELVAVSDLLRKVQAEGRDPTPEEVAAVKAALDASRVNLDAAIDEMRT